MCQSGEHKKQNFQLAIHSQLQCPLILKDLKIWVCNFSVLLCVFAFLLDINCNIFFLFWLWTSILCRFFALPFKSALLALVWKADTHHFSLFGSNIIGVTLESNIYLFPAEGTILNTRSVTIYSLSNCVKDSIKSDRAFNQHITMTPSGRT